MIGGKHLLLLAEFMLLARCQEKLTVSMWPKLEEFFPGDLFYLSCDNIASSSRVQWYLNNTVVKQSPTSETWKIAVASPKHSGFYHCENNGQRSDNLFINVQEYAPIASLTIKTGHPVMKTGHSVMLQLDNEDGLQGWKCGVYRRALNQMKKIKFHLKITKSVVFQTTRINVPETIFWCYDSTKKMRSNQIIIRASDKEVSLEMYPLPPVVGEPLTLRCLVWGTDQISNTVFYKDNAVIIGAVSSTHTITNVTELTEGQYKCDVTYTHKAQAAGPPYHEVSDTQEVFVQVHPIRAIISEIYGLSCSCPLCGRDSSYHWYHRNDDQLWASMGFNSNYFTPKASGSYACRAVWTNGRSFLSNSYAYQLSGSDELTIFIIILLVILTIVLVTGLAVWYKYHKKKSNTTGPVYEEVALRSRDENKYETLQKAHGARGEAEYDTLFPVTSGREKKEGDYQQLKKEEMKDGTYYTLGMEGAAGGGMI